MVNKEGDAAAQADAARFFGFSQDPIAFLATDSWQVDHCNDAFMKMFAPQQANLTLAFVNDLVKEDDRARCKLAFQLVADKDFVADVFNPKRLLDCATLTCGEDTLPKYRNFDWSLSKDPASGRVVVSGRLVNVVDDNRRKAEEEYKDFFDNAPIALHWLSGTGHVLWANKRELEVLGYTAEEYIGQPIMKFCPDEESLVLDIFKTLGSGNTIKDVPVRFRTKSGKIRHLLIDSNVNYTSDGQFNHTRCFIRDDTNRKVRESRSDALKAAADTLLAEKDRFLRSLLHEIRTPLHAVMGVFHSLADKILGVQDMLYEALDTGSRLIDLLNDFEFAANFDSGKLIIPRRQPFHLGETIKDELSRAAREIPKGSPIQVKLAGVADCEVVGDQTMIRRVLRHLVSNGIQHTKEGQVRVVVTPTRHIFNRDLWTFAFEIQDGGEGMSEELVNQCFQKYWTPLSRKINADNVDELREKSMDLAKEAEHGMGLGLNTAYNLVQCMGGELKVVSSESGTCFFFNWDSPITRAEGLDNWPPPKKGALDRSSFSSSEKSFAVDAMPNGPEAYSFGPEWTSIDEKSEWKNIGTDEADRLERLHFTMDESSSEGSASPGPSLDDVPVPSEAGPIAEKKAATNHLDGSNLCFKPTCIGLEPKLHGLIVEDNTLCQKVAQKFLEALGCTCEVASNGKIGAGFIRDRPDGFDFILMDLRMPVMDGFVATKMIRRDLKSSVPIIGMTADYTEAIRDECLRIGMQKCLAKPVKKQQLFKLIEKVTGRAGP